MSDEKLIEEAKRYAETAMVNTRAAEYIRALAAEVARLERENERLRREANDWHLAYVERMGVTPE